MHGPDAGPLLVVGGGILGALTAYYACRAGRAVTLVARGDDPRRPGAARSATFSGEDLRFVSLLEGRPYLGPAADPALVDYAAAFSCPATAGGWLDRPPESYDPDERDWLRRRTERGGDAPYVAALTARFLGENRASLVLWRELVAQEPELWRGSDVQDAGILRLYAHPGILQTAAALHHEHGSLRQHLDAAQLAALQPALSTACRSGAVAGGLHVDGLVFRAQTLVRRLLDQLQARGARLRFGVDLVGLALDGEGRVLGLRAADGSLHQAQDYALCVGAYDAPGLLRGLGADGAIMSVLGLWLRLPAPEGLTLPLKLQGARLVAREGGAAQAMRPVVDLNVHVLRDPDGAPVLYAGGGYLFTGSARRAEAAVERLRDEGRARVLAEVHALLERCLGDAYRAARARSQIVESPSPCLRSFTADDQELVLEREARGPLGPGRLILTAGGNTGTTAKAPLLAQRALARLASCREDRPLSAAG